MKVFATLLISSIVIILYLENILAETTPESIIRKPISELKKNVNAPPDATCANYEQICSDESKWRPFYPSESHCKSNLFWTLCTVEDDDELWSEIIDDSIRELEKTKGGGD